MIQLTPSTFSGFNIAFIKGTHRLASTVRLTMCLLMIISMSDLLASKSSADLIGATINISAYFPTEVNLFSDPGDVVVSDTEVEYPAGAFVGYSLVLEIDVTADQIIVTNTGNALPFNNAPFNGFILEFIDGPQLTSATSDIDASDFTPYELSIIDNRLLINFQGADDPPFSTNSQSFINIETEHVPEPSAVQILGLVSILAMRRRNRG